MDKIKQIFSGNKVDLVPIWIMRQAGRYMPEYRQVRNSVSNFLNLCYDVDKIVEVTLQPIKRFKLDAAIIFSDILVLPHSLGWDVTFEEGVGPILHQFKSEGDFKYLNSDPNETLKKVYNAISKVRALLPANTSLIGFAGGPWTVVSYILEGRGKQDFSVSKKFVYQNKKLVKELIDFITEKTIMHLIGQVKAGCNLVQLFDSWAGILSGVEYDEFVIKPTSIIVSKIKEQFPHIPIIGFPRGSGFLYEKYIQYTGIDAIGVDQFVPVGLMQKWQKKIVVQGNLDPVILLTDKNIIAEKVDNILSNMSGSNFIFNLGHGILPNTPIENVEFLVNHVREFRY
jgi:uroporphyrinogen decarboxylase